MPPADGAPPHKCPHKGRHLTGMEVCRTCDYARCVDCGEEFNQRDMSGGPCCHPCDQIRRLERRLATERAWQAERRRMNAAEAGGERWADGTPIGVSAPSLARLKEGEKDERHRDMPGVR